MSLKCILEYACMRAKWLQSCLSLHEPVDCSRPGSSVHGIVWARTLEWVCMPSSRGSSPPRDGTRVSHVRGMGRRVLQHRLHLGESCSVEVVKLERVRGGAEPHR